MNIGLSRINPQILKDLVEKGESVDRKIVVPDGMLRAAQEEMSRHHLHVLKRRNLSCPIGSICSISRGLEAALRWLSENPIVPTDRQVLSMISECGEDAPWGKTMTPIDMLCEWQRRMFLAPGPTELKKVINEWERRVQFSEKKKARKEDSR